MNNLFMLFWVPGSCGDIVQTLVSHQLGLYSGFEFDIDSQGRAWRKITDEWKKLFSHNQPHLTNSSLTDHGWLQRQWSEQDCQTLLSLSQTRPVIIGTHELCQLEFVKKQLGSQVQTIGICYQQSLHKFVIKNHCAKILTNDEINKSFFADCDPELFRLLQHNNAVGVWSLKNELTIQQRVPKSVDSKFDININLGQFLSGDLQWAGLYTKSKNIYEQWIERQNPLFTHCIPNNSHYDQCMGRNTYAIKLPENPIPLDLYDQTFIHFYCKKHQINNPRVTNHLELIDFFEKQTSKITIAQEN